jgi:hypothetical protein
MSHPVSRRHVGALCLALSSLCVAPSIHAADAPLRIGVPVWVGWMPWWVAQEKGLFKRNGVTVELRNFGVFEVKVRKARIGRNPNRPETDVPIPSRTVVKFKPGKEMRESVIRLKPEA